MKRKYADRAGWPRIKAHRFTAARVEVPAFHGVVALYSIVRVREPLYKPIAGAPTLIADNGYHWLQLYSSEQSSQNYTVTAMYTPEHDIAQWYIDVCAGHGVDHRGIPWHDDLYLDVIASGHAVVEVIDAADLDAAFAEDSEIPSIYHQAWRESHRLAPLVRDASLPEMRYADDALAAMLRVERGDAVSGYALLASRQ